MTRPGHDTARDETPKKSSTSSLLESAVRAADAARSRAEKLGVAVVIVVVDSHGATVTTQRMDHAYLTAETIARKKAFTAVNFNRATHEMATDRSSERVLAVAAADGRITFLMGGLPIPLPDGRLLGIGVSGASGEEDLECCRAAAAAIDDSAPVST